MKATQIMMVTPQCFNVLNAQNPHMVDESGNLNKIDLRLAAYQWQGLKDAYLKLGIDIVQVAGQALLSDMVFCANPFFCFKKGKHIEVILSNMKYSERQGEVEFFKTWFAEKGMKIHHIQSKFEGMGDFLWSSRFDKIFAGHGFRTEKSALQEVEGLVDQPIIPLKLINPNFYHLDTCLSVINNKTAAFVPSAFGPKAIKLLESHFDHLIEVDEKEAKHLLACNCHCPDEKNVIIQLGCEKLKASLRSIGLKTLEVDTSEFIKAGGSIFCMKHVLF